MAHFEVFKMCIECIQDVSLGCGTKDIIIFAEQIYFKAMLFALCPKHKTCFKFKKELTQMQLRYIWEVQYSRWILIFTLNLSYTIAHISKQLSEYLNLNGLIN